MNRIAQIFAQITVDPGGLNLPNKNGVDANTAQKVLQIVFGFAGAIALLVIIIAGLQFVLSQGDPQKTAKARSAIIYAIIGLAISILSFSIVTWIIGKIG